MLRPEIDPPKRHPLSRLVLVGALGVLLIVTACAEQILRAPTPAPATAQPATATPTPTPPATPTATPPPPDPTATPTALPPLSLDVQGPDDGTTVRASAVVVFGRTAPGATVTAGGVSTIADRDGSFQIEVRLEPGANRVEVDEAGDFSTTVTLEQGPNLIEVVGTSPDGRVLSAVLAVIFRP